jgi:hypothetical protein
MAGEDAAVRVEINPDKKTVLLVFTGLDEEDDDPEAPTGVEVTLTPELARDLAFTMTRASYIVEGDDQL